MVDVVKSATFDRWLRKLKDRRAAARILVRIDRLVAGNPGDVRPVGSGISELRIDHGPGYRVYYLPRGPSGHPLALRWRQVEPAERHRGREANRD